MNFTTTKLVLVFVVKKTKIVLCGQLRKINLGNAAAKFFSVEMNGFTQVFEQIVDKAILIFVK